MVRKTKLAFVVICVASMVFSFAGYPGASSISITTSAYNGPPASSAFDYSINTTYGYTYNFTALNHNGAIFPNKELWIPSLANKTELVASGKVYEQEFKILHEDISPYTSLNRTTDANGNYFYYFQFNIPAHGTWSLGIRGNLTLREITWKPESVTMAAYNRSDPMYSLYTQSQPQIDANYTPIVSEATLLNASNPYQTAKNVYNFVDSYLTYNFSMTGDYGAKYAWIHHFGDCTEFSYLMTALLRACGIPARVLRGIVIADSTGDTASPNFQAAVGTSWTFHGLYDGSLENDNSTGHAWCEYFIPGQGWITADPTWHLADNYTAKIDNVHVPYMTNLWIGNTSGPYPPFTHVGGLPISTKTSHLSHIRCSISIRSGMTLTRSSWSSSSSFQRTWSLHSSKPTGHLCSASSASSFSLPS